MYVYTLVSPATAAAIVVCEDMALGLLGRLLLLLLLLLRHKRGGR